MRIFLPVLFLALYAAPPVITELQPRGAQRGRPFTLTIAGQNLGEGVRLVSTLPASFTPMAPERPMPEGRYATFLVEPARDVPVGVYPVRVESADGISNVLLFSIGAFPEITEEESQPGSLPNSNDSVEKAQPLPSTAITLNGTLRGSERDVYRLQVKAGERRVFEIDARRAGSAVDPVIRVMDASGKQIARSDDSAILNLDPRLDLTFPSAGYYYVEIHDARFSGQTQNFYRLRTGTYEYATEVFPLGGRKGSEVEVSLGSRKVKTSVPDSSKAPQIFVNLPDSPSLPLPFAVGEFPESMEPDAKQLRLPVTVNGKLDRAGEIDRFTLDVTPGSEYMFELQARELGTSKLMGVITVFDESGKRLASAGDLPLPVDVFAVQASSRTAGDPVLNFKAPDNVRKVTVAVEDLAGRGGTHFAYRLLAWQAPYDFQATINSPFVNIPAGGSMIVNVTVDRRGYLGPLQVRAQGLPPGVEQSGGLIPAEVPDAVNARVASRRALLALTAAQGASWREGEITFVAAGKDANGKGVERKARGIGYSIGVAGATSQGVVDRQRPLTGGWMGLDLPAALAPAPPATLELALEKSEKKEAGYEFLFRWTWHPRDAMQAVPDTVSVDVPNFIDLRVIGMAVDPKNRKSGTFLVTSTRNTYPATYDIGISGRLMVQGQAQEIYSKIHQFELAAMDPEDKNATAAAAR
jgi:hypothetical protein